MEGESETVNVDQGGASVGAAEYDTDEMAFLDNELLLNVSVDVSGDKIRTRTLPPTPASGPAGGKNAGAQKRPASNSLMRQPHPKKGVSVKGGRKKATAAKGSPLDEERRQTAALESMVSAMERGVASNKPTTENDHWCASLIGRINNFEPSVSSICTKHCLVFKPKT